MPENPAITSSELGTLWLTYQQKTMVQRILEYFIEKSDDDAARGILANLYEEISTYVQKIKNIFETEGAAVPLGFISKDVVKDAPALYGNGFDIMFIRLMKEISMAMHTLNITMSYREDIVNLYRELTEVTQKYYNLCTQYLLDKGMLARSPYVTMPTSIEFVNDASYLGGLPINPFHGKRVLNTVEAAHTHHGIETNITGMQMITGFAQCAGSPEIKKYFAEGAEIAKSIVKDLSEILLQCGIQAPAVAGGNATRSTAAPFSDKLMMYCTSLFCSFALGGNSLGTAFSLRNDLPAKMSVFIKDIFEYAHKGAKIMIKNGWLEEPPQMEERKDLVQV